MALKLGQKFKSTEKSKAGRGGGGGISSSWNTTSASVAHVSYCSKSFVLATSVVVILCCFVSSDRIILPYQLTKSSTSSSAAIATPTVLHLSNIDQEPELAQQLINNSTTRSEQSPSQATDADITRSYKQQQHQVIVLQSSQINSDAPATQSLEQEVDALAVHQDSEDDQWTSRLSRDSKTSTAEKLDQVVVLEEEEEEESKTSSSSMPAGLLQGSESYSKSKEAERSALLLHDQVLNVETQGLSTVAAATSEIKTDFDESTAAAGEKSAAAAAATRSSSRPRFSAACDISQGRWVYDESYPLYRAPDCPFLDPGFRCEQNGRPNLDYMKYRWQPHDCDLPRFNATDMLERIRNQRMVFVGDSLGRNHWESTMCMLAEAVTNKSRIYEINGEPISKHTGFLSFRFQDYNCTVEYYRSPFLVPQTRPPPGSPSTVACALRVDTIWTSSNTNWSDADILVFNAGHWWTKHKIFDQNCYFQEGNELNMDMTLETGFQTALQTWGKWMEDNLDTEKTHVIFRSFSPVHFRGGNWNTGGHCDQETHPMTEEEVKAEKTVAPWTNAIILNELEKNNKKDIISFLDITTASNYRSDGHGALYQKNYTLVPTPRNRQDCSHFCLPGVPDTWNELMFATLLARGKRNWRKPISY